MTNLFKRFVKDESGATAIEYGLIAAIMAVVVIAALTYLDDELVTAFQEVGDTLTDPVANGGISATPDS